MFSVAIWAKFLGNGICRYERPNLCEYIRTILVYLPLILVINVGIYTSPLWIFGLVVHYYGFWVILEVLSFHAPVLLVFLAVAVVFTLVFVFANLLVYAKDKSKDNEYTSSQPEMVGEVVEKRPLSFTKMILQYLSDRHDMFCRQIRPTTKELK